MKTYRRLRTSWVACLLSVLSAATARAQQDNPAAFIAANGPAVTNGNNLVMILMAPAVQEELKLSDAQKTRVYELAREVSQRTRTAMQSVMQTSGGNPQALLATAARLRSESETAATQILEPSQRERAHQIQLRVEGPLAVAQPEIARKIGVSQGQTEEINATMMQLFMAQRQLAMQSGMGMMALPPSQTASIRQAAVKQITSILNAKQKLAFNKLLGDPFDLSKIDPELGSGSPPAASDNPTKDDDTPAKVEKKKRGTTRKKSGTP